MKWKEIQLLEEKQLKILLQETQEKLRSWRFQVAPGKLNNPRQIRHGKRLIGKIFTLLNQRAKL